MDRLTSTPPPLPPPRSTLAQAAPTILGVIGGIAGAIIGSIIPGAGTVAGAAIGASLGSAVGGGIGMLFKMGDDARATTRWQAQLTEYAQVRQRELQAYMQSAMAGQIGMLGSQMQMMGLMGMGFAGPMPGMAPVPVPGFQGGAVRAFMQ